MAGLLPVIKETADLCSDRHLVAHDLLHIDAVFALMEALFVDGATHPPVARQNMLNAVICIHNEFIKPIEASRLT